ncbi:phage tail protein [Dankookia sp. GCM10030260]|uniref:phage tail protein n=1 Tax=Dankookia sp. GCM10030260 TaxID=3273390 RepID=UPI003613C9AA
MGTEDYLASIGVFAGTFAPTNYLDCDGRILDIAHNQALFSLIGTNYGGNGTSTFALPDLRPRDANGAPVAFAPDKPRSCICVVGVYPPRP